MTYFYALMYDPATVDENILLHYIKDYDGIQDWWHYLPSVYFLVTTTHAQTISNDLYAEFSPSFKHLITTASMEHIYGVLPTSAWPWLQKKDIELFHEDPARWKTNYLPAEVQKKPLPPQSES